nr:hypothetical protein asmbl_7 [uncultured bacterium]
MNRSPGTTVGVAIAALLALSDISLPFGGDGRPMAIAVAGLVLGLLTLAGVVLFLRGQRWGLPIVAGTRVLSAVITLPTLVMTGVSSGDRLIAALVLLLTAVAVALVFLGSKWTRPAVRHS